MGLSLIGQALSKYRILEEIGRGGMGVVYKAHDTVLDRPVAIKVLAPHPTWGQEFVKRFLHEARAAAGAGCPHSDPNRPGSGLRPCAGAGPQ